MASLLTKESFEQYLSDPRPKALNVEGLPSSKIVIDPLNHTVSLQLIVDSIPDLALSERLSWKSHSRVNDGEYSGELSIQAELQMYEAYLLISDIAAEFCSLGEIQRAIETATTGFTEILEVGRTLSIEKQIGLIGELIVFRALMENGVSLPFDLWLGPEKGEHDFKLHNFDIEVKTTTSEQRIHKISNLEQLVPSPKRNLYLVSIQLTKAGTTSGISLSEFVSNLMITYKLPKSEFEQKLKKTGWRSEHSHLYTSRFELRTTPAVYDVSGSFPRLTLESLNLDNESKSRISDISYRLSLVGVESVESLDQFLSGRLNVS